MKKILHISDNPNNIIATNCICNTPDNLIKEIIEKYFDSDIFIINLNYIFEGLLRSQNQGILLLKLLRLHRFHQHCVVYSFLSREQLLLQDPKNLILFSDGITFIRMPENLNQLDVDSLKNKKSPENLSEYFKAETKLPDDRHFFANWWGVLRLWEVQKAVENIVSTPDIDAFESKILSSVREMNSYDGLLARYIKKNREKNLESFFKQLIAKKEEKFKEDSRNQDTLRAEIDELNKEKELLDIKLEPLNQVFQKQEDKIIERLRKLITKLPSPVQKKINEITETQNEIHEKISTDENLIEILNDIDIEKNNIESERKKINEQIKNKIDFLTNNTAFPSSFSLDKIKQKLAASKPVIVFVDDQAEDGWSSILQRMIYGEETENFVTIIPQRDTTEEAITQNILRVMETHKVELLILDLRLKGEKGHDLKPEHISGFQVLKRLKNARIECPVMITSASNKLWSFNETQVLGANAYWLKEGLDDNHDLAWSVENYLRLLELIYALCFSESYILLYKKVLNNIKSIERANQQFWWRSKIDNKQILDILNYAFEILEKYINGKLQRHNELESDNYLVSLSVIILSRILEIIFPELQNKPNLGDRMREHIDKISGLKYDDFNKLIPIRNEAVHSFSINYADLEKFTELFFDLLTYEKTAPFIPENNKFYILTVKRVIHFGRFVLSYEKCTDDIIMSIDKNPSLKNVLLEVGDKIKCKIVYSNSLEAGIKYYTKDAVKTNQ